LRNICVGCFHGLLGDRELAGDLFVADADGDQLADLLLAGSEELRIVLRAVRGLQLHQLFEELEHDSSPDPDLSPLDEVDRLAKDGGK